MNKKESFIPEDVVIAVRHEFHSIGRVFHIDDVIVCGYKAAAASFFSWALVRIQELRLRTAQKGDTAHQISLGLLSCKISHHSASLCTYMLKSEIEHAPVNLQTIFS